MVVTGHRVILLIVSKQTVTRDTIDDIYDSTTSNPQDVGNSGNVNIYVFKLFDISILRTGQLYMG